MLEIPGVSLSPSLPPDPSQKKRGEATSIHSPRFPPPLPVRIVLRTAPAPPNPILSPP